MKLNVFGQQLMVAPRNPVLPMEVSTKSYVDSTLYDHASDASLHVTAGQLDILDELTVTSSELNSLSGITGNVQSQLDGSLMKTGGTMSGVLTLHGNPSQDLEAATKLYVDTEAAKMIPLSGGTMTGLLELSGDPTDRMEAATKQYVDNALDYHAADNTKHLTTSQSNWLDALVITSTEANALAGIEDNVQDLLNTKFDKSGGTLTGDVTLANGKVVHVSTVPVDSTELVNKAYVDSKIKGQEWKNPISDPNLLGYGINSIPSEPVLGDTYIAGDSPASGWTANHVYSWAGDSWVDLLGRPVAPEDRFGVALITPGNVDSSLNGKEGNLITVTVVDGNNLAYTEDNLTAGTTTLVFDEDSVKFGVSYSLTDEGFWVATNTSANITPGAALELDGNTLNVVTGKSLEVTGDNELNVRIKGSSAIVRTEDGIDLPLKASELEVDGDDNLALTSTVTNAIADRVSKTGNTTVTGNIVIDATGSLKVEKTPTVDTDAATKKYVDDEILSVGGDLSGLEARVDELELDPVTKTYVNQEVAKKVNKAGDTMTGALTLNGAPTETNHAATKEYVDTTVNTHKNDSGVHLSSAEKTWLGEVTITSTEANHLDGVTGNVQGQLDDKLEKSGGTMTGTLTLKADPVNNLEASTKGYVDTEVGKQVAKAGDTMTGALTLSGEPTESLHASTKKYVDDAKTAANNYTDQEAAKKLNLSGGTVTGSINLETAPSTGNHLTNKTYVDGAISGLSDSIGDVTGDLDDRIGDLETSVGVLEQDPVTKTYTDNKLAEKLDIAGGTMTGDLFLIGNPSQALQAVPKQYVDHIAKGLKLKPAVKYATSENISASYNNGTNGVSATLTGSSNGVLKFNIEGGTVDVIEGDRVLIKDQTNKAQNGDYIVQQAGSASTPFILKRTTTVDESYEVPSSYFYVSDGLLKGTGWTFTVEDPSTFTIGTDDIFVNQFSGQGTVEAGDGIHLDGNAISVKTKNSNRIVVDSSGVDLATTGVTAGTFNKVTVDVYGRVTTAQAATSYVDLGLTDVQPLNTRLTNVGNLTDNGVVVFTTTGAAKVRQVTTSGNGISIADPTGESGNIVVASNATDAATPETVMYRDDSGNVSVNEITGALIGNANTATKLKDTRTFKLDSDNISSSTENFNGEANVVLEVDLTDTGVTAGEYTLVTVDEKGRVTTASKPTKIAELGITDVASIDDLEERLEELEQKFNDLFEYTLSRL